MSIAGISDGDWAAALSKSNRSLFNSWRSGGATSAGTSNSFNLYQIMATSSGIFKDCTHITFNETIKSHNSVTFKLVKTGELMACKKKEIWHNNVWLTESQVIDDKLNIEQRWLHCYCIFARMRGYRLKEDTHISLSNSLFMNDSSPH